MYVINTKYITYFSYINNICFLKDIPVRLSYKSNNNFSKEIKYISFII